MSKFVFSLVLMGSGIAFGQILRRRFLARPGVPRAIMRLLTMTCVPVVGSLSLWGLHLVKYRLLWIPAVGAVVSTFALIPAFFSGRRFQLTPQQMGSYLGAAMFSNVGYSLGGFVCLVLFGERALALAILYTLYLYFYMYGIGFSIARSLGSGQDVRLWRNFVKNAVDPIAFLPLGGVALGALLNVNEVYRPPVFSVINQAIVPVATFVTMFAIGLQIKFEKLGAHRGAVVSMLGIKFLYSPLIGLTVAWLLGFPTLGMKVVLVEASMPSAISALVMAILFGLDQRLATLCWIYTTLGFFLFAPLLFAAVRMF